MSQRALCIGINSYQNVRQLSGCVSDAMSWERFLRVKGFSTERLFDGNATRSAIVREMNNLLTSSASGDVIVITCSSHGTQFTDRDGQVHEALLPVDYDTIEDLLVDQDIGEIIDQLPAGVNLTLFFDFCHSGDSTRNEHVVPFLRRPTVQPSYKVRFVKLDHALEEKIAKNVSKRRRNGSSTTRSFTGGMREVLLAACQPRETSKEVNGEGIFTKSAIAYLSSLTSDVTNSQFCAEVGHRVVQEVRQLREDAQQFHWDDPGPQTPGLYCAGADQDQILFAPKTRTASNVPSAFPSVTSTPTAPDLADLFGNLFPRAISNPSQRMEGNTGVTLLAAEVLERIANALRSQSR